MLMRQNVVIVWRVNVAGLAYEYMRELTAVQGTVIINVGRRIRQNAQEIGHDYR